MTSLLAASGLLLLAFGGSAGVLVAGAMLAGVAHSVLEPVAAGASFAAIPAASRPAAAGALSAIAEGGYAVNALAAGVLIEVLGLRGGFAAVACGCLLGGAVAVTAETSKRVSVGGPALRSVSAEKRRM